MQIIWSVCWHFKNYSVGNMFPVEMDHTPNVKEEKLNIKFKILGSRDIVITDKKCKLI